ncbi:MAG: tetratricopeptide repeat protein [Deltaproteobacteria bacterium]|nr:tetratricopeptide repeat protein [Deltaproteobacteria bacterium]
MAQAGDHEEETALADSDGVDRAARFRRATRWVARIGFLLLLGGLALGQGTTSWRAVAAAVAATVALWVLSIPCVPHKRSTPTSFWVWFALGTWATLHVVPVPLAVVRFFNPIAAELHTQMALAAGLPASTAIPLAVSPGDAALQAAVYLLMSVHAYLFSNLLLGAGGRRTLGLFTGAMATVGVAAGVVFLAASQAGAETLPEPAVALARTLALVNPNHAAGFMNLCIAVTLGRAVHGPSRGRTVSGAVALILSLMVVATASRGGILTLFVVLLATLATTPTPPSYMRVDPRQSREKRRFRASLLAACALFAIVSMGWPIIETEFLRGPGLSADHKVNLWRATAAQCLHAPAVGWAPGGVAVLLAMAGVATVRIDFAENFLLDRLASDGWLGFAVFVTLVTWALRRLLRRTLRIYEAMPYVVAVGVMFVSNLADFSMEIAGVAVPFAVVWVAAEFHFRRTSKEQEALLQWRRRFHGRMMALTGCTLAAACWLIAGPAAGHLSRDIAARTVASVDLDRELELLVNHYASDAHAAYLFGRKAAETGRNALAARLLDRAITLRPTSAQPRLFRFAVRLELGDTETSARDLKWLLAQGGDHLANALEVARRSSRAEALLVSVLPTIPDHAYAVAEYFQKSRPDLIESTALSLRRRHPDRRFAIDALRALLYIDRGRPELAREIAAGLLAHKETEVDGYYVEARLMTQRGRAYEAFHLYRTVCERRPGHAACASAAFTVLDMKRPDLALPFLRNIHPTTQVPLATWASWWHWMAIALEQSGKRDEAIDAARRAHLMNPQNVYVGLTLADLLFQEALFGEAEELSERLSHDFPQHPAVVALAERVQTAAKPIVFSERWRAMAAPPTPTARP